MRKFLKYIAQILILITVLAVSLDHIYSYIYQNSKPRLKVQKILQLKNTHYDVAFFGSSRTENHIDCELVERVTGKSCINLGISGASITDMYILMEFAELNNIKFDKAFMQIDYNYNHTGLTNFFKAGIIPFINKSDIRSLIPSQDRKDAYFKIPFYRYLIYNKVLGTRELIASLMNRKNNLDFSLGFTPKIGQGTAVSGSFPSKLKRNNNDLDKMISLSEKSGTKLLFFTAPYCDEVENRHIIHSLEKRLPNWKNYISIFDNKEENYFNCGHLNKEGAQEFTKIITEDLILN
ncbi:hypothetical protein LB467_08505 [Salegentibacter sp. JZCK2]|uniref:hypothetical protein n=1 Tax=Salegentibacter tibetensis TaxID=2873600 RepID=UPI001CCC6EAA|nr:hypothetical protein [Salegentibacter tibetensis]MBZ9729729.1 hypothetical protein [Salegentibacter tibetensis]